jgi:hypothetical protein
MLVQLVDDTKGVTLASASTMEKETRLRRQQRSAQQLPSALRKLALPKWSLTAAETNMSDAFKQLPMPPAREV